jgi:serine/threonine protein kinase
MPSRNRHVPGPSVEDGHSLASWLAGGGRPSGEDTKDGGARGYASANSTERLSTLVELVKADLRRKWRSGHPTSLESYLEAMPELGTRDTVPAELILVEYRERRRSGVPAELAEYASRFPAQAGRLRQLIARWGGVAPRPRPGDRDGHAERSRHLPASVGLPAPPGVRPPRVFGRYRIIKRLGRGSMGTVYLAHDTQLDRQVALKVPHAMPGADPEGEGRRDLERFSREVRAAATLNHPNVCPMYDHGQIDGIYYLTMAYIKGRPLSALIARGGPRPQRWAAAAVRKLARALEHAHARGVIHRDLKPSNIMVTARGELVIMDFGLAWRVGEADARLTKRGAILGTPAYMSPEQLSGTKEAIGPRCDVYSLGVILYELLTARRPFDGPTMAILAQILHTTPNPPSAIRQGLDARLEAICLKAMAKRGEDRYATMGDLAAALGQYLRKPTTPPVPAPPSQLETDGVEQGRATSEAELAAPIVTEVSPPPVGDPHTSDAKGAVNEKAGTQEERAAQPFANSLARTADLPEEPVWDDPRPGRPPGVGAGDDLPVPQAYDLAVTPELERSFRAWTSVVEWFVLPRTRHCVAPEDYESLHRGLMRACRTRADTSDGAERELCARLEDLVKPWLTLVSLDQLDQELRFDLLLRSRRAELELHGRPQDARALQERVQTLKESAQRPPSPVARFAFAAGIGLALLLILSFLIMTIYQFVRMPSQVPPGDTSAWSSFLERN